ncbi:MAG: flavin reductase family protein [Eggerthellaceae bacterium]
MFTACIHKGRHTMSLLRENSEFTINVPREGSDKKILGYCGSHSGRDTDKIADLGLTLVEPQAVSVPAIEEMPLTLECRVLYMQPQVIADLKPEEQKWYPQDKPSTAGGSNKDDHITVYGEIVAAYLLD